MKGKKIFEVLPAENPIWRFGALLLAILAIIISFFSKSTIIFAIFSIALTIPAVIIGVYLLDLNIANKGISIATLICCKAAWLLCTVLIYMNFLEDTITYIVKDIIKIIF